MRSINPATEQLIADYPDHAPDQLRLRLDRAAAAFPKWRDTPTQDRARLLSCLAACFREKSRDLACLMTRDMGKPITAAEQEVEKCAVAADHFAQHGPVMLAPRTIPSDAVRSYVRYDPLGAVLAVMPWNFPYWQLVRAAVPALLAGNVILLKHAPNVPGCATALESLFADAGFPLGVFTTLLIDVPALDTVLRETVVRGVTLTGSTRAGAAFASGAAKYIKKSVLELGGSDPFIVLADVDVDATAKTAASARCINSGQSCIAAKRFLIDEKIAEEFEARFTHHMSALKVGDPVDRSTEIGPLARLDLLDHLHDQVTRSVKAGAQLKLGGRRLPRPGYFYEPTVLTDVTPTMPAFQEETFGPVAALTRFQSIDEAITLANNSPYGLGASIWTHDTQLAEQLAPRLDSGNVFINGIVKSDPRLPFGGTKQSGYGRELADTGLHEFTNLKTVWLKDAPASD